MRATGCAAGIRAQRRLAGVFSAKALISRSLAPVEHRRNQVFAMTAAGVDDPGKVQCHQQNERPAQRGMQVDDPGLAPVTVGGVEPA